MFSVKLLSFLLAASASMCSTNQNATMMKVTHPNGLVVNLPESLSVEQTSDGFLLRPLGYQELRSPPQIKVSLHINQLKPQGEWPEVRQIDGQSVYYRLEKQAGGSGGDIHILSSWKANPTGYIFVQEDVQVEEPIKPDFKLGWMVVEGARVSNVDKR